MLVKHQSIKRFVVKILRRFRDNNILKNFFLKKGSYKQAKETCKENWQKNTMISKVNVYNSHFIKINNKFMHQLEINYNIINIKLKV